jgi:transposase
MANRAHRFIQLSDEENEQLRTLEQNPHINSKVRFRAQILRLSHAGMSIERIAEHVGKSYEVIRRQFNRWETQGFKGLADHYDNHGQKPLITQEIKDYLTTKLSEDRTWTCSQLAEAVASHYDVKVSPQSIGRHLRRMGYSWKKGRLIPSKQVDAKELKEHQASLETLKRGHWSNA